MIIKGKSNSQNKIYRWYALFRKIAIFQWISIKSLNLGFKILAVLVIFTAYSSFLVISGGYAHKLNVKYLFAFELKVIKERLVAIAANPFGIVPAYFKGLASTPEQIVIDIKFKNMKKLEHKRSIALKKLLLVTGPDDYVPAKIRYNGETIKIKIRLKGDYVDHFKGDKWSFRVKTKGDTTLFGMKIFSLQHPRARGYIQEWIFLQALKKAGLIAIRYKFVEVIVNGKNLGIYAMEEHFDKRLIEHNKRKEGPILKFSEDLLWNNLIHYGRHLDDRGSYYTSHIDTFQSNKIRRNPELKRQSIKAISLVENYRKGKIKISDVFDTRKFSKFLALSTLMGAYHGLGFRNIRFYYNPITSKLEPIGYDTGGGDPIVVEGLFREEYLRPMTKDMVFFEEYLKELEKVSHPEFLNSFYESIEAELEENLSIIYSEFPWEPGYPDVFSSNQEIIRKMLNPVKALLLFQKSISKEYMDIDIGNLQQMPIEVVDISYKGRVISKPIKKTIIPSHLNAKPVKIQSVRFSFPKRFVWSDPMISDLWITYKLLGIDKIKSERILAGPYTNDSVIDNDVVRAKPNISEFDFLTVDEISKKIVFKSGQWDLNKNLVQRQA
jgi:hypothetical protein